MLTRKTERTRVTARGRILGWILLIVTIAVTVIVLATGRVLLARVDAAANIELAHETENFRTFASGGGPGSTFASVSDLLSAHLAQNMPEEAETFFTIVDARAHLRSPNEALARLDRNPALVSVAAEATEPESGRVDTEAGPAVFAVIPVHSTDGTERGALVIVEFLSPAYDETWSTILVMSTISGAALLAVALVGWLVAGRVLAPIREVRETAARISESDLGRRIPVSGTDDVAQLAATFNHMLDRLENAFAGQRRFLDDTGHELRTPLTIIRGHLAVMRDDPLDREQTLRLVNAEIERMSGLVDDLILLARSERPGFLTLTPVDIADLVVETLAKTTALGSRRWSIDAVPQRTAIVDGQRLTQALLQLASNAVDHTSDDDSISLGAAVENGRIRLWVSDTGTGVPLEDQERIFERFNQGAADGREDGSGLGLAIVARIAHAHGGHVQLESRPGEGATFTLDLPYLAPGDSRKLGDTE